MFWPSKLRLALHTILAVVLLHTAFLALSKPPVEFGDSRDYIIQTQAIVFDQQLAIAPEGRAEYWNATAPFPVHLDPRQKSASGTGSSDHSRLFGGAFGSLYFDNRGDLRYLHSWVYSLVVAPVYALLHLGGDPSVEYTAFTLVNTLLLFVPILVLWRTYPQVSTLIGILIFLASPVTPFLAFAHTEIFCLTCVLLSFLLIGHRKMGIAAPIVLGLGAAQNIPIVLFFPLHLWLNARYEPRPLSLRRLSSLALPYVCGIALPVGMMLYNLSTFDTLSPIAHFGHADLRFISLRRMLSFCISPMIGAFWFLPASWLAIMYACTIGRARLVIPFALSICAAVSLACATNNFYSAQLGVCRYALWALAPLYALPYVAYQQASLGKTSRAIPRLFLGIGLLSTILIQVWMRTWLFVGGDSLTFSPFKRATPAVATLYSLMRLHDDIEPVVENLRAQEVVRPHQFSGCYAWNLGDDQALLILSGRALADPSASIELRTSQDLRNEPELTRLMNVVMLGPSHYSLSLRHSTTFYVHPFLGRYLLIWVSSTIRGMRSSSGEAVVVPHP